MATAATAVATVAGKSFTPISTEAAPFAQCRVHPLVVVSILHHFLRRPKGQNRVFGALLGSMMDNDLVDLRNCFAVPFSIDSTNDDHQIQLDVKYLQTMLAMHRRANDREVLVGWYSSGNSIDSISTMVHDIFWSEMRSEPLHLLVDPSDSGGKVSMCGYYGSSMSITESRSIGMHWLPVPLQHDFEDREHVALSALTQAARLPAASVPLKDVCGIDWSLEALADVLDEMIAVARAVVSGAAPADPKLGRALLEAVSSVPVFDSGSFRAAFARNQEDLGLLAQLSKLARQHLALAEKLQQQKLAPTQQQQQQQQSSWN